MRVLVTGGPIVDVRAARLADAVQPRFSHRLPVSTEAISALLTRATLDSRRVEDDLGVKPHEFEGTLRDTVRWLVDAGHVPPRKAGDLGP